MYFKKVLNITKKNFFAVKFISWRIFPSLVLRSRPLPDAPRCKLRIFEFLAGLGVALVCGHLGLWILLRRPGKLWCNVRYRDLCTCNFPASPGPQLESQRFSNIPAPGLLFRFRFRIFNWKKFLTFTEGFNPEMQHVLVKVRTVRI